MFEGLREQGNDALHVKSTGCDDGVAVSLCAGSLNALALHGFFDRDHPHDQVVRVGRTPDPPGSDPTELQRYLREGLCAANFEVGDTGEHAELNGDDPCNIVKRTLLGMGAQQELSTPLREAMFTEFARRTRSKHTTTSVVLAPSWRCRNALDRLEAEQIVSPPCLRCP